ncbi:nitrogenase component 1 [Methanomassiliicoccaceae archaeon COG_1]|nr:nitrogenase component 1 [Methanomassiliicoccaceae archaeon COG_1]
MGRKIAVYGKGGIGKSTVSSNLTAALGEMGVRVLQIGCDPKHDSTRSLLGGNVQSTVLDYLRATRPEDRRLGDVVAEGYGGCLCVEAGGPEPGVGCAGRGIITAFGLLEDLGSDAVSADITLYDVLGDVVCGGFAVPMRNGYADTVYIVTSGEFMSIYAANNILRGAANYNTGRIGGIIFNSRGDKGEVDRVERFSEAVGVPIIARFARSNMFMEAERMGMTVVQMAPDSDIAGSFRELARKVTEGKRYAGRHIEEGELERLILGRTAGRVSRAELPAAERAAGRKRTPYASRNVEFGEPLNGCAFSGASSVCTSVEGLTTILHSPKSCAHFTIQLDSNCAKGARLRGYEVARTYEDPDAACTYMDEKAMIFGGAEGLHEVMRKQAAAGKRCFAVITGCPPGIIGDDARAVAGQIENEYPGTKVIVLDEDGNAAGDFMQGVIDAGIGLVRGFGAPGRRMPDSVNLIGAKTMSSSSRAEIKEVELFLARMDIKVGCVLPGMTDIEGLAHAPRACACLRLNTDAFTDKICRFFSDEYGIPTLAAPVRGGVSGACGWISCVGGFFGKERKAAALEEEVRGRFAAAMEGPRSVLEGRTCCAVSVSSDVSWVREAVEAAGMRILRAYVVKCSDYVDDLRSMADEAGFDVVRMSDVPRIMREIDGLMPDVLLSPAAADVDTRIYQSRLPYAPASDPYAGRWLAEDIARGMLAPAEEGWRRDAARRREAGELPRPSYGA